MIAFSVLALALQLDAARPLASAPDVTTLVTRARAARLQQDAQLAAYEVITRQRMSSSIGLASGITGTGIAAAVKGASIGALGAIGATRLAARYESVARLGWDHKFGAWGELIGARSVAPIVGQVDPVAEHGDIAFILPFYPGRDRLWPTTEVAHDLPRFRDWIEHPLATGADSVYRFSLGDSLNIKLPDNRVIHLREIRVQARRPSSRLIVGSLWVDIATGNLVRAAYRPSVPIDLWPFIEREIHSSDTLTVKRFGPFTGTIREIIVDHGLYEGRFWLPKTRVATGEGTASAARVTLSIEQTFEYRSVTSLPEGEVRADSMPTPDIDPRTGRVRRPVWWGTLRGSRECRPPGDSSAKYSPDSLVRDNQLGVRIADGIPFRVLFPCSDEQLLAALPGSIYATGEELFPNTDFEALRRDAESALSIDKQAAWNPQRPKLHYGIDAGMLRYNRIEGLSPGIGVDRQLGQGYEAGGLIRIGFADHQPLAEAYLQRGNVSTSIRGTAYRRLDVANDWGNPLALGSALAAALFGRDDGIYYRTAGAELTGVRRSSNDRLIMSWRLFGEQQTTARVSTQRSIANVASAAPFDSNIVANEGFFGGASGGVAYAWGLDPRGFVVTGNTRLEAARWRDNYARGMTELTVAHGFGATGQLKITGATGYSLGDLPVQRFWYLGGPYTVHSYRVGTVAGDAFWMGRAQISSGHPVFRPVVFSDLGWAGQRDRFTSSSPISSAGIGASALDGFVRFDVSRAITPGHQMRLDLYFEIR